MAKRGKAKKESSEATPKKPKDVSLPEFEDERDKRAEELADAYAAIRDRRMEQTRQEVAAKSALMFYMKTKRERPTYRHGRYNIAVVQGDESLKVSISDDDE